MKLSRIFVHEKEIFSKRIVFAAHNAHYLRKVLRLKSGDELVVCDGCREHLVRLTKSDQREVSGEIVDTSGLSLERRLQITLGFCCVRPDPVSQILRHGTELGVSRFVPLLSRRTARRPQDRKSRWDSIVESASAQSGRTDLPIVEPPTPLDEFVRLKPSAVTGIFLSKSGDSRLIFSVLEQELPVSICLLVGPEGGLDQSEESAALTHGFLPASLGPAILRTETAAIVAVGVAAIWYEQYRGRGADLASE